MSADGNCTTTLAHLDPFLRGEDPPCTNATGQTVLGQTCQVGDLSGKHAKIARDALGTYSADYTDLFASTKPGIGAFFGNRSFVIHFPNKTRITCANFSVAAGNVSLAPSATALSSASAAASSTAALGALPTTVSPNGPTVASATPTLATVNGVATVQSAVWAVGAAGVFAAIMVML